MTTVSSNTAATATATAKAKTAAAKAMRQKNNENTAKFLALGMAGIIVVFVIFHWTRMFYKRYGTRQSRSSSVLKFPIAFTRSSRRILIQKVPGFVSAGHALVFLGYLATCLSISFVNLDWTSLNNLAKRLGWVAVANLAFVIFLSLRNTPLTFLTAYSYERLNVLHQVAGYSTIAYAIAHAVVYIVAWSKSDNLHELLYTVQIFGITAGFAMLVILGSSLPLRKLQYETFLIIHIFMSTLILITVGMHRPDITKKTLVIVTFATSIWVVDRILRFVKFTVYSVGNVATITPLLHGGTRIVLRKTPIGAVPGNHCFLWIPGIRATESHPFTIISTNPLEFVVAAYDGFTRDLHEQALKSPGQALKASVDGPYGSVPDFTAFDKVIFIAGGSGASFTCGAALETLRKLRDSTATTIEFIWVVREQETIEWFTKELEQLHASPLVNLHIHHTCLSPPSTLSKSSLSLKEEKEESSTPELTLSPRAFEDVDIEKEHASAASSLSSSLPINQGRPDIAAIITDIVSKSDSYDRIAVAACGPDSMVQVARKAVAKNISIDGPSLELHCEQFGW